MSILRVLPENSQGLSVIQEQVSAVLTGQLQVFLYWSRSSAGRAETICRDHWLHSFAHICPEHLPKPLNIVMRKHP
jgi:hypothetical protein